MQFVNSSVTEQVPGPKGVHTGAATAQLRMIGQNPEASAELPIVCHRRTGGPWHLDLNRDRTRTLHIDSAVHFLGAASHPTAKRT